MSTPVAPVLNNQLLASLPPEVTDRLAAHLEPVELAIARYLPIYTCWTAIVVFVFPFLFGFE